ncbi:MAG: methionine adenosyltransferase [Patescibacteria group bacterium]
MNIFIEWRKIHPDSFEIVERKGLGHPDTLADALAEHLSVKYSKYTREKFGAILHHNFDKIGLLGGATRVSFGSGEMVKPIRVLINGRASTSFAGAAIPIQGLLIGWTRDFMLSRFPSIDSNKDLEFHFNISNQSSPGKTHEENSQKGTRRYWFEPRGLDDLQELKKLLSNDTSLGVGHAPYSQLEKLVLEIENLLSGNEFKKSNPWIGSDIKIMATRKDQSFDITLCIPQIAKYVQSLEFYRENLKVAHDAIIKLASNQEIKNLDLHINTRDNFDASEIYLTAIGSSIESGDEGFVGRGNRINGLITPMRLMSMEGACGKNPVYHIGKLYYLAAQEISQKIYQSFRVINSVALVSQSGRGLLNPWIISVSLDDVEKLIDENSIKLIVQEEIKNIPGITERILEGKCRLY